MTDTEAAFVLGTRPEIIKMAPVIKECRKRDHEPMIIHTGQHYSERLDAVFFRQLELPPPTHNLHVGSESHGEQTGEMLAGIESLLLEEEPDVVFVQGDTNSALAGALAASKLDPAVAHIEAGLRSFDREMPEETNRVLIDHVSEYLFPPTTESARLLRREGIDEDNITVTGNTIVDAVTTYSDLATERTSVLDDLELDAGEFCLLTAHRAENVDDRDRFEALLGGVDRFATRTGMPVVYPVHPRAENRIEEFDLAVPDSIRLIDPQEFFDFLRLEAAADLVFTDSGGVQEETCVLGTPCVTLRYNTERPETVFVGANCVAGVTPPDIVAAAERMRPKSGDWDSPFGDGRAGERVVDAVDVEEPAPTEPPTVALSGEL
jgi:UDP-N-acetylglucosamine 2-epimerase (non-hydrolysing)